MNTHPTPASASVPWTPEPWSCDELGYIENADVVIARCPGHSTGAAKCRDANAARIVACVNACAGLTDPLALREENRVLREALEACELWHRAETETLGTFHDRMELCSYSEWITKKALGLPCDEEWEGVPRIVLHFTAIGGAR